MKGSKRDVQLPGCRTENLARHGVDAFVLEKRPLGNDRRSVTSAEGP